MTETRKLRVFLCHASQDKPIVRELYQRLNTEGWIDPWLDEEKLLPGQDWDMEIEKAVETADAVIVCLSSSSVKKEGYIQKELRFALSVALEKSEETIFIVPLRLDECFIPRSLKSIQYIDYFSGSQKDSAYYRIIKSLGLRAGVIGVSIGQPKDQQVDVNAGQEFELDERRYIQNKVKEKIRIVKEERLRRIQIGAISGVVNGAILGVFTLWLGGVDTIYFFLSLIATGMFVGFLITRRESYSLRHEAGIAGAISGLVASIFYNATVLVIQVVFDIVDGSGLDNFSFDPVDFLALNIIFGVIVVIIGYLSGYTLKVVKK